MLKNLPEWAKIAVSVLISVILASVMVVFILVPCTRLVILCALVFVFVVIVVSMTVYYFLFAE